MPSMISWVNLADSATDVSATREADGLGPRNVLTKSRSEVWRIPNDPPSTDTFLDIDFGATVSVDVIALFAPRDSYLPPDYLVRGFGSTVSMGAGEVVTIAAAAMNLTAGRGAWWYFADAAFSIRYLRLHFTVGSTDDEYLQIGRLWVGPAFRPTIGADVANYARGWRDAGSVERAAVTGVAAAVRGATYRATSFTLGWLSEDESDDLEDAASVAGTTRQVIANSATQRGAKDLILGRFVDPPAPVALESPLWSATISLIEDL